MTPPHHWALSQERSLTPSIEGSPLDLRQSDWDKREEQDGQVVMLSEAQLQNFLRTYGQEVSRPGESKPRMYGADMDFVMAFCAFRPCAQASCARSGRRPHVPWWTFKPRGSSGGCHGLLLQASCAGTPAAGLMCRATCHRPSVPRVLMTSGLMCRSNLVFLSQA